MPPTIQSGKHGNREKSRSTVPKRSDIVCRMKYLNHLPDIPFDPKFIKYPFEPSRFVDYNATSLERNYKHEFLAEHDLGVTIDLINPETYRIDPLAVLDPKDEKLLEEDLSTKEDSKRSQRHARSVSWLRKTEYISSEYSRSQPSSDKPETKVAYTLRKKFNEEEVYQDRNNQIIAIQKTFEDAKKPIEKHYSKPFVTPVEILPVFPDFETWIHPCAQVNFDSDPSAMKGKTSSEQAEEMSQAMIRGMVDESEEQFVGYFLPTDDTMGKRNRDFEEEVDYREDEDYEYRLTREYNWNVKNKASKGYEENYFFVFRKGKGVFFNELETRVRLSKRRVKEGLSSNSLLLVKHRELSEQEVAVQEARLSQLENVLPEEEEMEDTEQQEDGQGLDEENADEENAEEEKGEEGSGEEGSGEENEDKETADSDEEEQEEEEQEEGEQEAGEMEEDGEQNVEEGEQEGSAEENEQDEEEMEHDREQDEEQDEEEEQEEGEQEEGEEAEEEAVEGEGTSDVEVEETEEREEESEMEHDGEQEEEREEQEEGAEEEAEEEQEEEQGEEDQEEEEAESEQEGEVEDEDHRRDDEQEIFGGDSDDESLPSS